MPCRRGGRNRAELAALLSAGHAYLVAMHLNSPILEPGAFENRRLRLTTVLNTRWLAVTGQALAVAFVAGYLQFPMPLVPVIMLIGASVILNLTLTWSFPVNQRLEPVQVFSILAFDVFQLAGLLYFTGGLENPFSVLLVVSVVIAAVSSPAFYTAVLALLVFTAATVLVFVHEPLPWYAGVELDIPFIYLAGIWAGVVVSLAFTAFYLSRVSEEARRLSDALAETELVLQREMHLSALDGLAAAAAHELGTPLSTISLVAKEMDRMVTEPGDLKDDIALLQQQARRCREILGRLTTLQSTDEKQMQRLPMLAMLEEVVDPHREFGISITVEPLKCIGPEPVGRRNPGIIYGLGNIVENAVDFAKSSVTVAVSWDDEQVMVEIADDGPGFSIEDLERLGEPDFNAQSLRRRKRHGNEGLGLGVFIAKTLLDRSGASMRFANNPGHHAGAWVAVVWPRKSVDTYRAYDRMEAESDE